MKFRTHCTAKARLISLLILAGLTWSCGGGKDAKQSAVLITMDTTRADALGCYGGPEGVTPVLDKLAQESVLYTRARAVAPLTLPSHSSMLTGLYPPRHSVRDNNIKLPQSARTLAERAKEQGFQTAAFVGSAVLNSALGTGQGFNTFDQPTPGNGSGPEFEDRPSSEVTQAAVAWLEQRDRKRPFFLWVHYFDPHHPYHPPSEFVGRFPKRPRADRYLGEVSAMDRSIGVLLDALSKGSGLEQTLVLVVADHGEALGEHGESTHSAYCYGETIRVPFLLRHGDGSRAGERSDEPVSVVDVYPTLVEAMGLGEAGNVDGISLLRDRVPNERGVYFESYTGYLHFGWSPLVGWASGDMKYLHSSTPELYDLLNDPKEHSPLPLDEELVLPMQEAIARINALGSIAPDTGAGIDQEHLVLLQNIGYASGATLDIPDPLEPSDLPSPKESAAELRLYTETQAYEIAGRRLEAIAGYEKIVAANPRHATALYQMGQLYTFVGRFAEAAQAVKRSINLGNDWCGPHYVLGVSLARSDRPQEAIRSFERALEHKPDLVPAMDELVLLFEGLGQDAQATEMRQRRQALAQ